MQNTETSSQTIKCHFPRCNYLHNLKITIINISSTLNVYAIHLFFKGSNYIYVDLRKNKSYFAS